jgi:two-component system, cell cycle sensor histidine kinase and response regulator CckA
VKFPRFMSVRWLEGVSILIVDDEPSIIRFATDVLQKRGAQVYACACGVEAQNLAGRVPALDLVLTDVILPDIMGVELLRVLHAWHPDARAITMSGYVSEETAALEGTLFLEKPFTAAALLERVQEVLAVRS